MPDEQNGLVTDHLVDKTEEHVEDVVGAPQRQRRRSPPHPRQVGVDPTETAVRVQGGLEAGLGLAWSTPAPFRTTTGWPAPCST